MDFVWFSYDFLMIPYSFHRFYYEFLIVSYGNPRVPPMDFPWILYGLPIVFLCFPIVFIGFTMIFL